MSRADRLRELTALLESITGIALPKVPLPMLQLLHAMQLVEAQESGFAPRLYDWVALAANPADELERRFGRLMGRPALVAWLSGELGLLREPVAPGRKRRQVANPTGQRGRQRHDDVASGDLAALELDPDPVVVLADGPHDGVEADPVAELGGHSLRDLVAAADDAGLRLDAARTALALFEAASAAGDGGLDHSGIYRTIRQPAS